MYCLKKKLIANFCVKICNKFFIINFEMNILKILKAKSNSKIVILNKLKKFIFVTLNATPQYPDVNPFIWSLPLSIINPKRTE